MSYYPYYGNYQYYRSLSPIYPSLNIVTPPTKYPLTIDGLKNNQFLKDIDIEAERTDFDILYIPMATEKVEKWTGRRLLTQTWKATFDCLVNKYSFPYGMLQSVSSIKVIQDDGTEDIQDPDNYSFTTGDDAKVWLKYNSIWDTTNRLNGNFVIEFVIGWLDAADLPVDIKANMYPVIADLYYNREALVDQKATLFNRHAIIRM